MRHVSNKSCIENQNRHFMLSYFFQKSCPLSDSFKKVGGAREAATGDVMAHCRLD
jgi:hypothetical protein